MESTGIGQDRSERVLRWIAAGLAVAAFALTAACEREQNIAERGDDSAKLITVAAAPPMSQAAIPLEEASIATLAPDTGDALPEAPPVTYDHALSVFRAGRFGEAIDLFVRYVEREPTNPWGHYMLGIAAWKARHLDLAEAHLLESVLIEPGHAKGRVNLARVLIELGQPVEAERHATVAEALAPGSVAAKRTLARALAEAGDLEAALAKYDEALWLDPEDRWSLNNLGYLLIQQGRHEDAIGPLALAARIDSTNATFQNNLGSALEGAGHAVAALQAYRAAETLDANHSKATQSVRRLLAIVDPKATPEVDAAALAQAYLDELWGCGGEPADTVAHRW